MGKPKPGHTRCLYCSMEKKIFQCFSYFVYKLIEYFQLFVSPCDGGDEKEPPSPVGKGERARLRVGGSTPNTSLHGTLDVETYPPAIRLVPLPFQGRTKEGGKDIFIKKAPPARRLFLIFSTARAGCSRHRRLPLRRLPPERILLSEHRPVSVLFSGSPVWCAG